MANTKLTISRKMWKSVRPEEAKDSGVGGGMDTLLKNYGKHTSVKECALVLKNIKDLRDAFEKGERQAESDKTFKENKIAVSTFNQRLKDWREELDTLEKEIVGYLRRYLLIEWENEGMKLLGPAQKILNQAKANIEQSDNLIKIIEEKIKTGGFEVKTQSQMQQGEGSDKQKNVEVTIDPGKLAKEKLKTIVSRNQKEFEVAINQVPWEVEAMVKKLSAAEPFKTYIQDKLIDIKASPPFEVSYQFTLGVMVEQKNDEFNKLLQRLN
jgi:hypothetical protein